MHTTLKPRSIPTSRELRGRPKVFVGMSGGVDSSVAALLLKKQGYDVIGAFIKNWSEEVGKKQLCWIDDRRDALRVAGQLGIPFVTFDFEPEFRKYVVDYLYREYAAGRTPNPDIMCNKFIKFPLLLREARKMGADYIATGHYVRLERKPQTPNPKPQTNSKFKIKNSKYDIIYELNKAKDLTKDQSYFLYTLDQAILKRCLFPLGELTKKEVRKIAEEHGLATAGKPDSQGICFVGEFNMREFLRKRIPDKPGKILTIDGKVIGNHRGLHFYTEGQRRLIGIGGRAGSSNDPLYVVKKDIKSNNLIVGTENSRDLFAAQAKLENIHWIAPFYEKEYIACFNRSDKTCNAKKIYVKVRYRAEDASAALRNENGEHVLRFEKGERAVTPGQSVVFYDGDKMLGGGIIKVTSNE